MNRERVMVRADLFYRSIHFANRPLKTIEGGFKLTSSHNVRVNICTPAPRTRILFPAPPSRIPIWLLDRAVPATIILNLAGDTPAYTKQKRLSEFSERRLEIYRGF